MELLNNVGCRYSDIHSTVGLDGVVGTANSCGLDVSGRDFPHLSIPALGVHSGSCKIGTGYPSQGHSDREWR